MTKGMNLRELHFIADKLASVLTDGLIQRIFMINDFDIVFDIRTPGASRWLLISLHPRLGRIHEIDRKPEAPKTPPAFCMAMRKYLVGGRVVELAVSPDDRIVSLWIERGEESTGLIAELFGPSSNSFLIDEKNRIIDVLSHKKATARNLLPKTEYLPPTPAKNLPEMEIREFGEDIAAYFENLESRQSFDGQKNQLSSALTRQMNRSAKYLARMKKDFENLEAPEALRKLGDLLAISQYQVKRGMTKIEVTDIYDPGQSQITIPLDPKKGGPENVELIYKKAKKNKRRLEGLAKRIDEIEKQQNDFKEIKKQLETAESTDDLDAVSKSLNKAGIDTAPKSVKKKKRQEPSGPREYVSADGVKILVGRNAKENDEMTFRIARGNDYWLHVLGEAGTHVVVLLDKKEDLKQETLLDAATLAIMHSRLKTQGFGDVTYTRRKYVTKPKGAPPGRVTHSQAKTVHVKIEQERVERLMGKKVKNY